jgi:hypothetical protein
MRRSTLVVFLTCLVVYHTTGRPQAEVDCVAAPYTAFSLVRHGSLDLHYYSELRPQVGEDIRELSDGTWVSMRPPGSAFMAVPFIAPFAVLRERPPRALDMLYLGKISAAFSVAAAASFLFAVCKRLIPNAAWPATLFFAFGTCLCSVASQALWMHGPATCWLCCALYFLTRADSDRPACCVASGLALGLAVVTRPTVALFGLATVAAMVIERRWRELAWLMAGGAAPAVFLCLINWAYFGDPIWGGYAFFTGTKPPPLWLGMSGLLVAPSRGVLIYSPALLLIVPGIIRLLRVNHEPLEATRLLIVSWLVAASGTLLFYARWTDWRGGWCYGPRYLCETMPILCLTFGIGYAGFLACWKRRVAVGLVVLSVAIHLVGIFGHSGYTAWQLRHSLPDEGRCLLEFNDTQIEAHARALARKLTLTR